jgi:hypothetical protein
MLQGSCLGKGVPMKTPIAWAGTLLLIASLASAKPLPLEAPDPARGVVGIRIKVIPPAKIGGNSADAVYFVRVVEEGDRFNSESLVHSNYSKGEHVYLLNAKPGRYVAVGCDFDMGPGGGRGSVAFSKDGKSTGTVSVDEKLFGDKIRKRLLHQVVVIHEDNSDSHGIRRIPSGRRYWL